MPIKPAIEAPEIILPEHFDKVYCGSRGGGKRLILWGDGIHDDGPAMQAAIDGKEVFWEDGSRWDGRFDFGEYKLGAPIRLRPTSNVTFKRALLRSAHDGPLLICEAGAKFSIEPPFPLAGWPS